MFPCVTPCLDSPSALANCLFLFCEHRWTGRLFYRIERILDLLVQFDIFADAVLVVLDDSGFVGGDLN